MLSGVGAVHKVTGLRVVVVAGVCLSCGSTPAGPSAGRSNASFKLTAEPDPVPAANTLTYRVEPGASASPAPQLAVHLPGGATDAKTSGTGWVCQVARQDADVHQSATHLDVTCSNALMALVTPPLTVRVKAPSAPGSIRACVMASRPGGRGTEACVTSRVVP